MKRFDQETKQKALESIRAIGVKKTSEKMGLSVPTLYKWRNESTAPNASSKPTALANSKNQEAMRILREDDTMQKKVRQLEEENENLRKTISRMKKALAAMFE